MLNENCLFVPDVNECENELQCPGKECVNSVGSFKCVSCQPGFELHDGRCQGITSCQSTHVQLTITRIKLG